MRVIAIDQGTTSTRAYVMQDGRAGEIICRRTHKQSYPQPGRVEHDPLEIMRHVDECLAVAGRADAIGIDNQGESCMAWDRDSLAPVSPIIVWQDQRTVDVIDRLKSEGAEDLTLARAGLPLDAYFSASKLAWMLENLPEAQALHKQNRLCLGTTDAYFLHHLTGRFVTDVTTASRTSLMNLQTGQWDGDLCALFNVPIECLPDILPTMGDFGVAKVNGQNIPVTASVVDQQAALYGHGCRKTGDAKITFGTGAFALAVTGATLHPSPKGGLLPTIAWQQTDTAATYALEGGVTCAGSAINWGRSLGLFKEFSEIEQFQNPAASDRNLIFVPALAGLGCPHWDRSAAGMWLGLSLETTAADMMQAMLEGIAFRAGEVITALAQEIPLGDSISIDGGLCSNGYFCQFLADVLQKEITIPANPELTATGTALMAAGITDAIYSPPEKTYAPQTARTDAAHLFEKGLSRARGWH
jgi:glycerol kinase